MNLQIHGNHIEVTPALRDYVAGKLARIDGDAPSPSMATTFRTRSGRSPA